VESIGQLYEDYAEIFGHGQKHLPHILGPFGLTGGGGALAVRNPLDAVQLGDPVDDAGNFSSEIALDIGEADRGVLYDVVEKGGDDRGSIEAEVAQYLGDGKGMSNIEVAGRSLLAAMGFGSQIIGTSNDVRIGGGKVLRNCAFELVDAFIDRNIRHGAPLPRGL